jgi:putative ABC transport system permease protein
VFRNNIKIALRNILKYKTYSFINIAGLAFGMACCILISLWVTDELSYDRFHKNGENIYRVINKQTSPANNRLLWKTPPPLAPALKSDFPEFEYSCRFDDMGNWLIKYNDKSLMQNDIAMTDPDFFNMFDFTIIKGDPQKALSAPNSMVLTKDVADKIFSSEDPIGKMISIDNRLDFIVTAIMENTPPNSHLQFSCLVPFALLEDFYPQYGPMLEDWSVNGWETYVQLKDDVDRDETEFKIASYLTSHKDGEPDSEETLKLQPLKDIYLRSINIQHRVEGQGDIKYVNIFTIIALFVLLIAGINFMNLTTARSSCRAREIGVKKASGAYRGDLIKQFLGESVFLSMISFMFALIIVELVLPAFSNISGKELSLNLISNIYLFVGMIAFVILIGILAGLYPALMLSSFKPALVLKGTMGTGGHKSNFRKILVIAQFAISILLIICTLVVSRQLNHIHNIKLGFDKDHIVSLRMQGDLPEKYNTAKQELLNRSDITDVAVTSSPLRDGVAMSTPNVIWEGENGDKEATMFNFVAVGSDFIETMGIEMAAGIDFQESNIGDDTKIVINETAARAMGFEQPVGQIVTTLGERRTILGVVRDYHFESMHNNIKPLIMLNTPNLFRYMQIKISSNDIPATLRAIENVWNEFSPDYPFSYKFLDEDFANLYAAENRMQKIFTYFTTLAILISCLGIFSLSSFLIERRTKEIGIRKVLGASLSKIILLVSREFLILVAVANIIAWPVGYLAMKSWLNNYAYRTSMELYVFLAAGILAILIAIITISFQSIKAALANPVNAIKHE